MNVKLVHTVLLVLGILGLLKSIWGLIKPFSMKRFCEWWSRAVLQVNTLMGCVCILIGILLWVVILIRQPLANLLLAILGVFFAWIGTVYFRPADFQKLLRWVVINRSLVTIRLLSLISAVVCIFLIVVAIKGF